MQAAQGGFTDVKTLSLVTVIRGLWMLSMPIDTLGYGDTFSVKNLIRLIQNNPKSAKTKSKTPQHRR